MGKTYKIVLIIFLLLVGLLTYLEASKPAPVNWAPSYSVRDKIPLGGYVLFESIKNEDFSIKKVKKPPYEFLTANQPKGTYFFLNDQLLFDDAELDKLLTWISYGNTAFLASDAFGKNLLDTLNLNVGTAVPVEGVSSKPMFNLVQPEFKAEKAYLLDHEVYHSVFIEIDTAKHTVLGVSQLYLDSLKITNPEINYIKIPFGKGEIYMHTAPKTFSNYFILDGNNFEYVEKALAYLPSKGNLYWDQYYKAGKIFHNSPLYILFNHKALKWAYYFVIFGSILFIIFEG
ncbi:MAG TPA: DUF4350 domain-containing protein, partial [Salinimicrobium sp.]|nr:DUF4350 domain-containing protein [Salinimicrobium sp.]